MSKKSNTKWKWGLLIFLLAWIVFAQSCMKFRINDSQAKQQFEQRGLQISFHYTDVGDFGIHYAKTGNDSLPTLFFVHGSPGSWDAFKMYLMDTILLRNFRMISIDRPGFGYSNFGDAMGLQEQTVLINKVIAKEFNGRPVHLIGHSIGGPVIVQLAQDYPDEFASLTILSGSISPDDEPREYWRYLFVYSPLRWLMPGAFKPSNDEIVYFKKELYQLDKGYARIRIPVTFIHGDADKFVTVKNVAYGKLKLAGNPSVNAIIITSAGHFITWDHFELIREHLVGLVKAPVGN